MALKTKLNKSKVFQLLRVHADEVREFGVSRLGLFGSMVRDDATNDSDIDILAEFKEGQKTYRNFIYLVYFLEDLLQRVKNLPDELREKYNHIDWKPAASLRDRIVHGYFNVDFEIIWNVIQTEIPILKQQIETIIQDLEEQ